MSGTKVKIETPNQLPESGLTRVQFKTWKECMIVYLKQSDDFLHFLPGGFYDNWIAAEENENRIAALHNDDKPVARQGENQAALETSRLTKRQRDLSTMLSIIGRKVDQYDHDDVMNGSTSLDNIWFMIELVYDIGKKGIHFLELDKIKYVQGESPIKFYKKVYHHIIDNLYKKNDKLKYKNDTKMQEDEKLSPTLLNFMLFHVIQSIDSRLMKKVRDKWGHLLDKETCLHDLKDTILKAIPDLLKRMDTKEFEANALTQLSAFTPRGQRGGMRVAGQGRTQQQGQSSRGRGQRLFCRVCYAARSPRNVYTSHNVANCSKWSRKDVEDLRVMMVELQTDPSSYPESSSDTEQD